MNKLKNVILSVTYLLFFFFNNGVAVENKILFKINNEIITTLDIFNEVKYLKTINEELKEINKDKIFEIAKRSLIREKIKEIELIKIIKEIKIEDNLLNNLIIDIFKDKQIQSISDFENYFYQIDIDPNLIKKKISIEIMWNQFIYSKYIQSVKINKKAIENDLLNTNKQKEFLVSEILFNINEGENLDTKYNLIKKSIEKTSFSEAALIFSTSNTASKGGKLGWIKEVAISLKIKNLLNTTKIGELTSPIVIPGGFLILKKEDFRVVNRDIDFKKEFEMIIREKTNEQLNQFSNIYFNKIKKNITINEL